MAESPTNGNRDLDCGAEDGKHVCFTVDGHSGQHKCKCGHQWGARSDGY